MWLPVELAPRTRGWEHSATTNHVQRDSSRKEEGDGAIVDRQESEVGEIVDEGVVEEEKRQLLTGGGLATTPAGVQPAPTTAAVNTNAAELGAPAATPPPAPAATTAGTAGAAAGTSGSARATTTITSRKPGATESKSFLSSSVANSSLSWWQLLCIVFAGIIGLVIAYLAWSRRRSKAKKIEAMRLDAERAARDREVASRERRGQLEDFERELGKRSRQASGDDGPRGSTDDGRRRRRGGRNGSSDWNSNSDRRTDSEESWTESEDYDSVSDGGTLVPRRRRRRRRAKRRDRDRDRDRGRRRRPRRRGSYSDSESEYSDDSYESRRRQSNRHSRDKRDSGIGSNRCRSTIPPVPGAGDGKGAKKRETNFRDSVFSSYHSMKEAAVRLKLVEAKVKLQKQLEAEERIDAQRKAKVEQANKEIEANRRLERRMAGDESARSDQPLLIPPVAPRTCSSGASSQGMPTPPSRAYRKASDSAIPMPRNVDQLRRPPTSGRQSSADSYLPRSLRTASSVGRPSNQVPARRPTAARQATKPPVSSAETGFGGEIRNLLGNRAGTKPPGGEAISSGKAPTTRQHTSNMAIRGFAPSDDRARAAAPSVPVSPRTSVYLPVTHPKDRPIIPRGKLEPAPPPKAKLKGAAAPTAHAPVTGAAAWLQGTGAAAATAMTPAVGTSMAGVGAGGGNKWADRLRQK